MYCFCISNFKLQRGIMWSHYCFSENRKWESYANLLLILVVGRNNNLSTF